MSDTDGKVYVVGRGWVASQPAPWAVKLADYMLATGWNNYDVARALESSAVGDVLRAAEAVAAMPLECPDRDCVDGGYYDKFGEPTQCQWCDQVKRLRAAVARANGETK